MASYTIDLMGDSDDTITIPPEETEEEKRRKAELHRQAVLEILKRMPQPQVVPVTPDVTQR